MTERETAHHRRRAGARRGSNATLSDKCTTFACRIISVSKYISVLGFGIKRPCKCSLEMLGN